MFCAILVYDDDKSYVKYNNIFKFADSVNLNSIIKSLYVYNIKIG